MFHIAVNLILIGSIITSHLTAPIVFKDQEEPVEIPQEGCEIEFPDREVYSYDMSLYLDDETNTVGGHVDFTFFNDSEDTWNELYMRDYPSLFSIKGSRGATSGGAPTEIKNIMDSRTGSLDYERDASDVSVISIDLSSPLLPGDKMTLSYDFVTTIPVLKDRFGLSRGVYNVTNFYPILCEYVNGEWSHLGFIDLGECFYSEISNYHVTLEVPEDYTVCSTGTQTGTTSSGDTVKYEFEAPFVRDFVFCASKYFFCETRELEGVRVNVLYDTSNPPAKDMPTSVENAFTYAENSLKAFGDAFGRYPYEELDIVFDYIDAGGMEYPNLVIITDFLCNEGWEEDMETTICHEIGHQWFMGIVGNNSAGEPWLDESFASYCELVYYEYTGGSGLDYHVSQCDFDFWDLRDRTVTGYGNYIDRSYDEIGSQDYVLDIYYVGKALLYQMELSIGEEEFHSVIRTYVHKYAFTNTTTYDFLEVLYSIVGYDNEDLNALVDNMLKTKPYKVRLAFCFDPVFTGVEVIFEEASGLVKQQDR